MEKLFPVPVFFPHSLSLFLSSSSFVRTTHSSFSYCSSLSSSLPPLPPWQPSFTCAESSLAFSLSPLSSRVGSFVRSCFSPAWILFVFCLPLFFSLHSSFVSPRPSRSVSSVPCVPLPPPFFALFLCLSTVHLHTMPFRFSCSRSFLSLFSLFFFFSVCARSCVHASSMHFARKPLSLPQAVIIAGVLEAGLPSASRVDSPCLWLSVDSDTRSYSWKKNLEVKDGCVRESLTRWLQRWSSTTHVTKSFNN